MPSCRRFSRPSEHLGSSSAIASTSDVCAGSGRSLTGQSRRVMWSSVSLATGVPRGSLVVSYHTPRGISDLESAWPLSDSSLLANLVGFWRQLDR
jgi:hypothetical protein